MADQWGLLVVSDRWENKRALLRILSDLPLNVFTASKIEQAREVLAVHSLRMVFCEENFADGSYRDLLASIRTNHPKIQLVLMLSTGEWPEYLEATKLGAAEVIRCPLQPTDVELSLMRAARQEQASAHELLHVPAVAPVDQPEEGSGIVEPQNI